MMMPNAKCKLNHKLEERKKNPSQNKFSEMILRPIKNRFAPNTFNLVCVFFAARFIRSVFEYILAKQRHQTSVMTVALNYKLLKLKKQIIENVRERKKGKI